MNIVQLHLKTEFFLDSVRSPRFHQDKVDDAINTAINDIILDRYHNIRKDQKEYAFQTSQRLRDELYTLVKDSGNMPATSSLIPKAQFPTDYWLLLNMQANISGVWINTIPLTYDELNVVELDPYAKPKITYPYRIYRIENAEGVKIVWGEIGTLIESQMYYIANPIDITIGLQVSIPLEILMTTDTTAVIAYIDSTIKLGPYTQLVNLKKGEKYVLGTYSETSIQLMSGILYKDFVETDVPDMLHDEICRKAAAILSGNVENYNRDIALKKDIENVEN